jgi:hypothetical protein
MKITIFSEELRKCLNSAGLSDCGENDTWNYWYQRLMNAYNESVERQIMTEQAENAKLRELLLDVWNDAMQFDGFWDYVHDDGEIYNEDELPHYYDRMRELGLEVE